MDKYTELLDLNTINKEWLVNSKVSEDRKLELRLGPPGEFLRCKDHPAHGTKRAFQYTAETRLGEKERSGDDGEKQRQKLSCIDKTRDMVNCTPSPWSTPYSKASFSPNLPISKKLAGIAKDFSWPRSSRMAEVKCTDGKVLPTANTGNASNKRIEYSPVVGWPPVRSFRKNLAGSSLSKAASESTSEKKDTTVKLENSKNQLFVKINMEGIPIGRKVNLSAYNSYEELSLAIDDLFSGFLAGLAQRDSSATQNTNKSEELAKQDADSLAGIGEYTLIYEDDEGDWVLVGDVPWHMFISTAKRLHVLKSSELSNLRIGSSEKDKTALDPAMQI